MSDTRDLSEAEKWVRDLCGYDDEAFRLLPLTAMEQSIANAARARIAELEEAARRYFNADGSVSLMASAEAVVEARKAAARRIAELEAQVRERDGLLRQVLDPDDCRLDHHGFCQTHGWMDRSGCPHARIRSLIGGAK